MKIIQILPGLESGGVEKGTLEIAEAAVAAGHQSYVMSAGGRLVELLEKEGSIHVKWDIGRKSLLNFFEVKKIRRWLESEHFDIVHVRSRMPAWVIWTAWKKMDPATRPRLISTVHGMHSVSRYSEIMTCGEQVIAVSKSIQHYILSHYPRCSPDKIQLIYRGIDPQFFPRGYQPDAEWLDRWYREYPQTKDRMIISLPGRLTRLKGHLAFLELLAKLRDRGIDVIGLIVGDEDPKRAQYAQEIYRQAEQLELTDKVVFTGHRSDMREIYAISKLVLSLSSKPESFGRTVLEALSMGIPVIGYDHGGVSEILDTLFPEGAVPLNQIEPLLEKTIQILNDRHVEITPNTMFLLSNMQRQTLELYQKILEQGIDQ